MNHRIKHSTINLVQHPLQPRYLSSVIISLMLVLPACAKEPKQSTTHEQTNSQSQDLSDLQADATSAQATQTAQPSSHYPVIVFGKDVAPLSNEPLNDNTRYDVMHAVSPYFGEFLSQWKSPKATVRQEYQQGSRGYTLGMKGYSGLKLRLEAVKAQLQLNPNEILLMGFSIGASSGAGNAIDFGNGQLLTDANNLMVNYLRYKKTPELPKRGQLEKTADYDQRVQQVMTALQQSTQSMTADLGLLEETLNFAAKDFAIQSKPQIDGTDQYITYNHDQETISLVSEDVSANDKRFRNVSISFTAHCPLALAKQMLADNHMARKGNRMAFVLRYQNQQLYIDRVIILDYNIGAEHYEYIGELRPDTITLHSRGGNQLTQNPDVVIRRSQPLPFKFGLSSYQAPRIVAMSEEPTTSHDPESAESLANAKKLENELSLSDPEFQGE